jgi:hypothetical protein
VAVVIKKDQGCGFLSLTTAGNESETIVVSVIRGRGGTVTAEKGRRGNRTLALSPNLKKIPAVNKVG